MKCDGIVRDQNLITFQFTRHVQPPCFSFGLNVFHSLLGGNMPNADDGVPYWDIAGLSNQICGWTLCKCLGFISNCQKLHEWWLFIIPKALTGIINDCKVFHGPAVAVICIQWSLSLYWFETASNIKQFFTQAELPRFFREQAMVQSKLVYRNQCNTWEKVEMVKQ